MAKITRMLSTLGIELKRGTDISGEIIHKFGANEDVDTAAVEDVWLAGGTYSWPTSASTLEAISTSTNDDDGGTGAQTITIEGLDGSFAEVTETLTMNGTSATTATTNSFIRVNRAYVASCGTYSGSNDGDITIRISSAGATQCLINSNATSPLDYGQSFIARYSVPAGKSCFLTQWTMSVDGTKTGDFYLCRRENADDVTTPFSPARALHSVRGVSGENSINFDYGEYIDEKTDLWVVCGVAQNNTIVTSEFELIQLDRTF